MTTSCRESPANIMFDKRVVRGNTYAAQVLPPSAQAEAERRQIEAEQRARRRELEGQTRRDHLDIPRTPSPVDGRRHIDVQTENYLEELSDRVPEVEEATQTEAFMDRPPSPLFIPTKTGLDKETQILPGDLFDFDLEVEPILEVLVGKTLEQGLMEVLEEEELENIRKHQEEFEQIRNAELAEVQRLEEEVKRKDAEKVRCAGVCSLPGVVADMPAFTETTPQPRARKSEGREGAAGEGRCPRICVQLSDQLAEERIFVARP